MKYDDLSLCRPSPAGGWPLVCSSLGAMAAGLFLLGSSPARARRQGVLRPSLQRPAATEGVERPSLSTAVSYLPASASLNRRLRSHGCLSLVSWRGLGVSREVWRLEVTVSPTAQVGGRTEGRSCGLSPSSRLKTERGKTGAFCRLWRGDSHQIPAVSDPE